MTTPYVEYTDEDGNKSKLEFEIGVKQSDIQKFYTDHIKDNFDKAKSD